MSIAILLATHNASKFICETLDSISRQERQPDEVVAIDDASSDNTLELVAKWAKSQPFAVRIVQNELPHRDFPTPGPAGSRTTGLSMSQCDLIAILDDDDLMLPCHLRLTEQALLRHPELELCFGDATVFNAITPEEPSFFAGKGVEHLPFHQLSDGLRVLTAPLLPALVGGSFIPTAANLWRRKSGLLAGGFDRRAGGSDDLLFFSTLSRLGGVAYYPFPIARRRVHANRMSNPRNALRHCWDHVNIMFMLLNRGAALKLNGEEVEAIQRCIVKMESEILYHASRHGLGTYWESKNLLGEVARTRSRDLLRALLFTGRRAAAVANRSLKMF